MPDGELVVALLYGPVRFAIAVDCVVVRDRSRARRSRSSAIKCSALRTRCRPATPTAPAGRRAARCVSPVACCRPEVRILPGAFASASKRREGLATVAHGLLPYPQGLSGNQSPPAAQRPSCRTRADIATVVPLCVHQQDRSNSPSVDLGPVIRSTPRKFLPVARSGSATHLRCLRRQRRTLCANASWHTI